jgi:3-hydroxybutyryl-CoA dehydrogenase
VVAMAGYDVRIFDENPAQLEAALGKISANLDIGVSKGKLEVAAKTTALSRISPYGALPPAVQGADLVIEATPERLALKRALFAEVGALNPRAILGTNTSSLSIAGIAAETPAPERVIGLHFFNPVHLMALLEIVVADATSPETVAAAATFAQRIGKEAILVKDRPGFATSRLGVALGMEAIRMVQEGVASAEDIDKAMKLGYRHPMGPLELTDHVGLDVRMAIGEYLAKTLENPAFEPPDLMRRMVAEGHLGRKTGQGFYRWS